MRGEGGTRTKKQPEGEGRRNFVIGGGGLVGYNDYSEQTTHVLPLPNDLLKYY